MSKEHFCAIQIYRANENESEKDSKTRRRDGSVKLKAVGFRETYFHFTTGDKDAEVKARTSCEKLAAEIFEKTGIVMSVSRGCFL